MSAGRIALCAPRRRCGRCRGSRGARRARAGGFGRSRRCQAGNLVSGYRRPRRTDRLAGLSTTQPASRARCALRAADDGTEVAGGGLGARSRALKRPRRAETLVLLKARGPPADWRVSIHDGSGLVLRQRVPLARSCIPHVWCSEKRLASLTVVDTRAPTRPVTTWCASRARPPSTPPHRRTLGALVVNPTTPASRALDGKPLPVRVWGRGRPGGARARRARRATLREDGAMGRVFTLRVPTRVHFRESKT